MRFLVTLTLVFLSLSTFGQIRALDRGNGDFRKLAYAVTVLELIEQGKVLEVYAHLSDNINIETTDIEENIRFVSVINPHRAGSNPPAFLTEMASSLWYERTYFERTERGTEYQVQIYLKLTENKGSIKISEIQFRRNDEIEQRTKELGELDKVGKGNSPPPPAPTGMK